MNAPRPMRPPGPHGPPGEAPHAPIGMPIHARARPRWPRVLAGLGLVLAVAAATHALVLWALPRLVMHRAMATVGGAAPPAPVHPPPTEHTQRRIVMPSPDLLYGVCVWNLTDRPLRIRADLRGPGYASLALYAANSDNFLVINDRQAGGVPLDLWLTAPGAAGRAAAAPAGARAVTAPTTRGLLLMRVLVGDRARDLPAAEATRATLRCEPG